mgnify:FL=1
MRKLILTLSLFVSCFISIAQDSTKTKTKEYYLTFADFSLLNLQLKYKRQISKSSFIKLGLINLSANIKSDRANNSAIFPTSQSEYSAGLEFGIEFRKQINKKFSLYHGPSLGFSYNRNVSKTLNPLIPSNQQKNTTQIYKGSIPYTLGILFNLNSNILVSAELNPSINYNYIDFKYGGNSIFNTATQNYNIGFNNKLVLLSIVYRL